MERISDFSLEGLVSDLESELKTAIDDLPEVEQVDGDFSAKNIPNPSDSKWVKLPEVVVVFFDLKNSTHLGVSRHDKSSARIYTSAVESSVKILHEFEADFIDIQGDGGFGIYWGDMAYERAFCAAVTIRTFSETLVKKLEAKWVALDEVGTGFKVGMHAGRTLVKKLGTRNKVSEQEPVWAGKPVNYAAKCAQSAQRHQIVVTQSVWDKLSTNDHIAFSCGCSGSGIAQLWQDKTVETLPQKEQDAVVLNSQWCDNCGEEFCREILTGSKRRQDVPETIRNAVRDTKAFKSLQRKKQQENNTLNGLKNVRVR